jgi:hypothetical protein
MPEKGLLILANSSMSRKKRRNRPVHLSMYVDIYLF